MALAKDTLPLGRVLTDSEVYAAVMLPGGHGTVIDFPNSNDLKAVVERVYETNGVVGAVCHGQSGLLSAVIDDKPIVSGECQLHMLSEAGPFECCM